MQYPIGVCSELDNVIANPELLPLSMNEQDHTKIGQLQRSYAPKCSGARILSKRGLNAVMSKR